MEELNELVAEVTFRERIRGYDYDQVDAYVSAVSRVATKALARLAQLQSRLEQAEPRQASGGQQPDDIRDLREKLVRTLVRAEQTKDSIINEARTKAAQITETAREQAERMDADSAAESAAKLKAVEKRAISIMGDAKVEAQRVISRAKLTADAESTAARSRLNRKIKLLNKTKSDLVKEIAGLEAQRDEHRQELSRMWQSFAAFVDEAGLKPGSEEFLSIEAKTEPSPTQDDTPITTTEARSGTDAETSPADASANAPGGASAEAGSKPKSEKLPSTDTSPKGLKGNKPRVERSFPVGPDGRVTQPMVVVDAVSSDLSVAAEAGGARDQRMVVVDAVSPELSASEPNRNDRFVSQLRQVITADSPPPKAQDAMAVFFGQDVQTEQTIWNRKRF